MALEAPTPQGHGGDGDGNGAANAAGTEPEPKTYSQQSVEAIVASRLRNSKKSEAALTAKVADLERRLADLADPDDAPENENQPPKSSEPNPTASSEIEKWRKKAEKLKADAEADRKALQERLATTEAAHARTRIAQAITDEIARRGNVVPTALGDILRTTPDEFEIVDGQIVPKNEAATTLGEFFDKFFTERPHLIRGPVSGGGERSGGLPGRSKVPIADRTTGDLYAAGAEKLIRRIQAKR